MKKLIYTILFFCSLVRGADRTIEIAKAVATIQRAARVAGVPSELLIAICMVESNLRPNLAPRMDGNSHSYGLCQVKYETAMLTDKIYKHRNRVTKEKLSEPFTNAFYAAKYLKYQLKRYNNNWQHAVDAYNKGSLVSADSAYVRKVKVHLKRGI